MSDLLDRIKSRIGEKNLSRTYVRNGCRVYMSDIPRQRLVADMDLASKSHKIKGKKCDFVLFIQTGSEQLLIAPLELKRGADTDGVQDQLQAGARFASGIISNQSECTLRPILIHGKRLHETDRKDLNRAKINFRGDEFTIKTTKCGRQKNLVQVLMRDFDR